MQGTQKASQTHSLFQELKTTEEGPSDVNFRGKAPQHHYVVDHVRTEVNKSHQYTERMV